MPEFAADKYPWLARFNRPQVVLNEFREAYLGQRWHMAFGTGAEATVSSSPRETRQRLEDGVSHWITCGHASEEVFEDMLWLLENLDSREVLGFTETVARDEKDRMDAYFPEGEEPVTPKQEAYLRRLGHTGRVKTKRQARSLIDEILKEREEEKV